MSELKGGQQFFSNYLKAFGETVNKLTELVKINEELIPRYSNVSDNTHFTSSVPRHNIGGYPLEVVSNMDGFIRIKYKVKNNIASALSFKIQVNGVDVLTQSVGANGILNNHKDVQIENGDIIKITSTGSSITLEEYSICYDLIKKPDLNIKE